MAKRLVLIEVTLRCPVEVDDGVDADSLAFILNEAISEERMVAHIADGLKLHQAMFEANADAEQAHRPVPHAFIPVFEYTAEIVADPATGVQW